MYQHMSVDKRQRRRAIGIALLLLLIPPCGIDDFDVRIDVLNGDLIGALNPFYNTIRYAKYSQ